MSTDFICDRCGGRVRENDVVLTASSPGTTYLPPLEEVAEKMAVKAGRATRPKEQMHLQTDYVMGFPGRIGGGRVVHLVCGPIRPANAQDDFLGWLGV